MGRSHQQIGLILLLSGIALALPLPGHALPILPCMENDTAVTVALTQARKSGRCYLVNSETDKPGSLYKQKSDELSPGRYRFHVLLARAPLGDNYNSAIEMTVFAGQVSCTVSPLKFAIADEFIDCPVDFTLTAPQRISCGVAWSISPLARDAYKSEKDPEQDGEGDDRPGIPAPAADGTNALIDLATAPHHLAAMGMVLEKRCPVTITTVHTDKITYHPGEPAGLDLTLSNSRLEPANVQLRLQLISDLATVQEVSTSPLTVPAGGLLPWHASFPTRELSWGVEVRATVTCDAYSESVGTVVTVTDNYWTTAAMGGHGPLNDNYDTKAGAENRIAAWLDDGINGFECFFWAPCDFSDFTPDTERFLSGQTQYRATQTSTKNLIAAAHAHGMAATVYANLWCVDGVTGFETFRKHPEWFVNPPMAINYLDRYPLVASGQLSNESDLGFIHIDLDQAHPEASLPAISLHAKELIASHQIFGWDGVRYDSYYSNDWVREATQRVRAQVEAVVPTYRFGYNTFPEWDANAKALDVMYQGGSMAMLEYVRQDSYPELMKYADELLKCRNLVWPHGGQLGVLYSPPRRPDWQPPTPLAAEEAQRATSLDAVYVSSILLATGCHPYYNRLECAIGDFQRCGLRFSGVLWDNHLRTIPDPSKIIQLGNGANPLRWQQMVSSMPLNAHRTRLVLQLLNIDPGYTLYQNSALKTPSPLRNLPITVNLPAGAKISGAWCVTAVPTPQAIALTTTQNGTTAIVTVPEVRFWNAIVIEYTDEKGSA